MKVVIVGGGFAGLQLARKLNNKPGFTVVLIDKLNYHQFQPLFYQVATAGLDASNISFPLRKVFHGSKNVHVRMASVLSIKDAESIVVTDEGEIEYDVLVLATGADTNFFGNRNMMRNALPMKSTTEALQIRHRLLQNFEDALTADKSARERLMKVVIVGGGPTGVELSGAIAEMKKYTLPKDFPELDFTEMKIYLLESGPKTLGVMSDKSAQQSREYLENLGVTVMTDTVVKDFDGEVLELSTGENITTSTVIWAAGVKGNLPAGIEPSLIAKGNRVKVDRFNQIVDSGNIYAIGDIAYMETEKYPHSHPQVASVAIQQATLLAENLIKIERKSPSTCDTFEYFDKGSMATVGRHLAVVDLPKPKLHFGGILAWYIWMFLHLMLILGVKNRVFVFLNWVVNYFTHDQSLRLIFRDYYSEKKQEKNVREAVGV